MKTRHLAFAAVLVLLIAGQVISYSTGAIPGTLGILGIVPPNAARTILSCGQCHQNLPGQNGLHVTLEPSAFSLRPGQAVKIRTAATGGVANVLNQGGFLAEATTGSFIGTPDAQIDPTGLFATHVSNNSNTGRVWSYLYIAPAQPGPVDLFSVVNTVNGDGFALGDNFGFRGFDGTAFEGTPVRLYVNAPGVRPFGDACVGSFENTPVLGAKETPMAGNQNFAIELVGAVENASVFYLIGRPLAAPLPLSVIGLTGCFAYLDIWLDLPGMTSNGRPRMGEGTDSLPLPLPASLPVGSQLSLQAVIIDLQNGRPLPLTLTNAVEITVQ